MFHPSSCYFLPLWPNIFPILDTLSRTVVGSSTHSYLLYVYMSPINSDSKPAGLNSFRDL